MAEIFTRFNRKSIDDRKIDTLIGISKGLIADNRVDQAEAEFLQQWLVESRDVSESPIISNLLTKVSNYLEDGVLDKEESKELLRVLRLIAGPKSALGEVMQSSQLPINDPLPGVEFTGKVFLFTGTCVFGTRKQCNEATAELGGIISKGVTQSLDYLVLGTYVTDSWIHETYGRKIEKAMEYRDRGLPLAIITEEHWANSGNVEALD
jgi:NAD-dependent DNA ligase